MTSFVQAEGPGRGNGVLLSGAPGLPAVHKDYPLHLFCNPPSGVISSRAERACFVHVDLPLVPYERGMLLAGLRSNPGIARAVCDRGEESTPIYKFWHGFLDLGADRHNTPSILLVSGVEVGSRDRFQQIVTERFRTIARSFGCELVWISGASGGDMIRAIRDTPSTVIGPATSY